MALAIATNNAALRAAASASSVNRDMETSMVRLSSGKRINSASDDAAGVAISSRLTSNIRGTDQAIRNALDGQALIDTAEGAHKEIENILQRMREVAVQAANDTNNAQDRANLQAEMDALSEEINRIAGTTTWAGTKMLDAESSDFSFHIGAGVSEQDQVKVSIGSMTSSALGLGGGTSSSGSSSGSSSSSSSNIVLGYNGSNSHPGENNTSDVKIAWGSHFGITFTSDTTGGAVSIVEISGVEYTVSAGTIGSKAANLTAQLSGAGHNVADYSNITGYPDGLVGAAGEVIQDYADAYDSSPYSFELYGNPLDSLDGVAADQIDGSDIPDNFAVNTTTTTTSSGASSTSGSGTITTPQKVGSEFQVNTYTNDYQDIPVVTALEGGEIFITWRSNGQDGHKHGIFGQIYNPSGDKVGAEFQINTHTQHYQNLPSISALEGGGFIVTWTSGGGSFGYEVGQDGHGEGIYGQLYDGTGNAIGGEFLVNTTTGSDQQWPSVTGLLDGGFIVAWSSGQTNQNNGVSAGPYGQRYDNDGNRVGIEFKINETNEDHMFVSVSKHQEGGFVATWHSNFDGGQWYGNDRGVYGQIFDFDGNKSGGTFHVNSHVENDQMYSSVTSLTDGGFIVIWESEQNTGGFGIYGQRYDVAGNVVGSEFKINIEDTNFQATPFSSSVVGLEDGGFVVAWTSGEQDGEALGVYAQRFDETSSTMGNVFKINSYTSSDQRHPSISATQDGVLIAVWESDGQDGSGRGVFAQMFDTGSANKYYSPDGTVYTGETHTMDGVTMSGASHTADSFILTMSPPANNEESSGSSISSSGSSSSSGPTLDSPSNAMAAITAIDNAIKTVNIQRSKLGAVSNRLSHTVNNLTNISSNLSAAQGGIEDADFAKETTDLAKNQILQQASTAMLAQANASKQNVLSLLQG